MKSKLTLILIIAATSMLLLACSPGSNQASVQVSCDDFTNLKQISKEVEVAVGDSFTVTLCSNPTTGFGWESAKIGDQTVLQLLDQKFVPPEETDVLGAPGKEVLTLKALKKGTSSVSMEYSRPWEGGEKAEWTFELTVVVK